MISCCCSLWPAVASFLLIQRHHTRIVVGVCHACISRIHIKTGSKSHIHQKRTTHRLLVVYERSADGRSSSKSVASPWEEVMTSDTIRSYGFGTNSVKACAGGTAKSTSSSKPSHRPFSRTKSLSFQNVNPTSIEARFVSMHSSIQRV